MTSVPVIVVGVDGSPSSQRAVRWATQQAKLTGATLRAVSSWRWPNYITIVPPGVDLASDTRRTLDEVLEVALADSEDVSVTRHVIEGPPGPALLTQAQDATLLVVGAQGRAAFPGMLLGSVAEYCVRHGSCPVVVVRP
jgi:Universal stress protein UspA and related nucleotide-binding proteins